MNSRVMPWKGQSIEGRRARLDFRMTLCITNKRLLENGEGDEGWGELRVQGKESRLVLQDGSFKHNTERLLYWKIL